MYIVVVAGEPGYSKEYHYDTRWIDNPPPIFETFDVYYRGRLEYDTLYVDQLINVMSYDSLILGPGGVLVIEEGGVLNFDTLCYFGVEATEENPAWIIQNGNLHQDPFAVLEQTHRRWDDEWEHLNLDLNCSDLSLPEHVTDIEITSRVYQLTLHFACHNDPVEASQLTLEGYFRFAPCEEWINLGYSMVHGRVTTETDITIDHCTFAARLNDWNASAVNANADCEITNSFFFGSYVSPAIIGLNDDGVVRYSGSYAADDNQFLGFVVGEGMIYEDPLFVDPEDGDYHLTPESPLIDAGDPDSPIDPDGTRTDIGAFFYDWRQHNDVDDEDIAELPQAFEVDGPWPNPFNGVTTVQVAVPQDETVEMVAFDVLGRELGQVYRNHVTAGSISIPVDLSDYPAGVYFLQIRMGNESRVVKALLLK